MRRGRPFGLTIALLACTVLYGLYPLGEVLFYLIVQGRRPSMAIPARLWPTLIFSLAFLVLLVPAWLGRPPRIRVILIGAVLVVTVLNVVFALVDLTAQLDLTTIDAATDLSRSLDTCSLTFNIVVGLYIVWYLNRYPARAYYRGEVLAPPGEDT
ncbi:MAG: hypothetical protein JW910_01745 [Anaerolineae bacterium]|nr:hypothetical protein [Anaerolineae bacterium]